MDLNLLFGIIIAAAAVGASTALIIYCLRLINRISGRNLSSLREIERDFGRGR